MGFFSSSYGKYTSDRGIIYSLYEGATLDGGKTSDILFIMVDNYSELPARFVNFVYGAGLLTDAKSDTRDTVKYYIDKWERENRDILEQYTPYILAQRIIDVDPFGARDSGETPEKIAEQLKTDPLPIVAYLLETVEDLQA